MKFPKILRATCQKMGKKSKIYIFLIIYHKTISGFWYCQSSLVKNWTFPFFAMKFKIIVTISILIKTFYTGKKMNEFFITRYQKLEILEVELWFPSSTFVDALGGVTPSSSLSVEVGFWFLKQLLPLVLKVIIFQWPLDGWEMNPTDLL